jgi:uncharacterized membrane protein YphA (DoxX/SURF4 family)
MRILHFISRIIVGLVFMFSGFVKGIDPLGFAYRLEDYFAVWGTEWMTPAAIALSILLSTAEFVLGFVVLFNLKPRVNAWLLLGMMAFFTVLTFYDALENPVPDCGCFGDAIKLTNWQTFFKNVILMIPTIILFIWRKKTVDRYNNLQAYGIAALSCAAILSVFIYSYRHLPIIDFMEWKVGNKMYSEEILPVKYYVTYRNTETGEEKEYLLPDYPYNDSTWMSKWEFLGQRVEDPNQHPGSDLQIVDLEGNDVTGMIIRNPDLHFLLIAWNLHESNEKGLKVMREFANAAEEDGYAFSVITSSLPPEIDSISKRLDLNFTFYQADDVVLKTMVRANPGLIMMKDGVVLDKWSHVDFEEYADFKKQMNI